MKVNGPKELLEEPCRKMFGYVIKQAKDDLEDMTTFGNWSQERLLQNWKENKIFLRHYKSDLVNILHFVNNGDMAYLMQVFEFGYPVEKAIKERNEEIDVCRDALYRAEIILMGRV